MNDWKLEYLADAATAFSTQRSAAERAIAQLDDAALFRTAGTGDNSVAVLMKHIGGNLRSRWAEPFTSDGEKPDRNRDGEFEAAGDDGAAIRRTWDSGWTTLEETLASLTADDLDRPLMIGVAPLSLTAALHRSLAHTAQHVGQIILLAKQWQGADWRTLSIPRRSEKP
ncbi:MAG: DUF1572 family protein [Gemmatimonadota bacterium]